MPRRPLLGDIHESRFEETVIDLTNNDIQRLARRSAEFVETGCPACLARNGLPAYELLGLQYLRCRACSTVYLSPCPPQPLIMWYLETSEALRYWREEMPLEVRVSRQSSLYDSRTADIVKRVDDLGIRPQTIIDVGGGGGELATSLAKTGLFRDVVVVEPQPLNLHDSRIRVVQSSFEELVVPSRADVVVAFEVLEHIVDPETFLSKVREILKPDGVFIFSTPNVDGFETSVLKTRSRALWFDHVRLYNTRSIEILVGRCGFVVVQIETPGRLDLEIVAREHAKTPLDTAGNPALEFLLGPGYRYKDEFREFLRVTKQSSHMLCTVRPSP